MRQINYITMKKIIILCLSIAFIYGIAVSPECQIRKEVFTFDTISRKNYIKPIYQVFTYNVIINRFDYYVKKVPWSDVNPSVWWHNINRGFMTDGDAFFTNWMGHPFQGSLAFNAGRMNGLGFYESTPYVVGHTLLWEFFAETEPPSIIDLYSTTFGGIYLGEITYRMTDYAWNHPSKYKNLRFRKIIGGLINPVAAINRWALGKNLSFTSQSLTPMKLSLNAGLLNRFDLPSDGKIISGQRLGVELNYGDILNHDQNRYYAFDLFSINSWVKNVKHYNTDINKIYFNFQSDAVMLGKKYKSPTSTIIITSIGQQFDYIHNDRYKLSNIALTGEVSLSKISDDLRFSLATKLGVIIYGSSNSEAVKPIHPEVFENFNRDYLYGHGLMLETEGNIDLKKIGVLGLKYNHYRIISKENPVGQKNVSLLHSAYDVPVYQNLNLGIRYDIYKSRSKFKDPGEYFQAQESYNDLSLLLVIKF